MGPHPEDRASLHTDWFGVLEREATGQFWVSIAPVQSRSNLMPPSGRWVAEGGSSLHSQFSSCQGSLPADQTPVHGAVSGDPGLHLQGAPGEEDCGGGEEGAGSGHQGSGRGGCSCHWHVRVCMHACVCVPVCVCFLSESPLLCLSHSLSPSCGSRWIEPSVPVQSCMT